MTRLRTSYVEKTFTPDIQSNMREVAIPAPNNTFTIGYYGAVVALRRVARLFVGGREVLSESWGPSDGPDATSHCELNERMDVCARKLAINWGSRANPLRIASRWQSARRLMDGPRPVGFTEARVPARHVPLFAAAADMLHTHPDIKGAHEFTIYIDTDTTDGLPLDYYSLIGVGPGQGTLAEPDWLSFEELATYAVNTYEGVYAAGEPDAAFHAASEAMRQAF